MQFVESLKHPLKTAGIVHDRFILAPLVSRDIGVSVMIKNLCTLLAVCLLALGAAIASGHTREAGFETAVYRPALYDTSMGVAPEHMIQIAQSYGSSGGGGMVPPSVALKNALRYSPGSQGLGVRLMRGSRLVYAVKLKTGSRIHRVLVDAKTGQVVGQ